MSSTLPSTPPTDAEIIAVIRNHAADRANEGVKIAQALTDITCSGGVVTAVFNPSRAGLTVEVFGDINPFENLAQFVGTPIAFDDSVGQWFRQRLVRIDTELPDGSPLGSLTADELHELRTTGKAPE
ncbi:hypothetical protein RHDE110596_18010 [Prescottella defluvii]|uniref:hypothetical protein n=1 Tax=Prescottella defluvii TaxID=1323361 RepID=UPI0004F31804|nr:hypothetical protein [Prescottella defluvii]